MLSGVALAAYVVARGNAGLGGVRPSVATGTENRSKSWAGRRSLIAPRTLHIPVPKVLKRKTNVLVQCFIAEWATTRRRRPTNFTNFRQLPFYHARLLSECRYQNRATEFKLFCSVLSI
jgi:hypothetical protein